MRYPAQSRKRGNCLVEFSFLAPWYIFLFAGAFDFGICSYALVTAQNAARMAAAYCSTNSTTATDSVKACTYALDQLRGLPNVGSGVTSCSGSPVTVTAGKVTGPDGVTNGSAAVSVTYATPALIPLPGIFSGQISITRTVTMRIQL